MKVKSFSIFFRAVASDGTELTKHFFSYKKGIKAIEEAIEYLKNIQIEIVEEKEEME